MIFFEGERKHLALMFSSANDLCETRSIAFNICLIKDINLVWHLNNITSSFKSLFPMLDIKKLYVSR